uniref:ISXO2-like transposase domain-containing protein n=1 Tax=Trichuris muris TaxID=70415 RepID=A0A5S6QA70_TRIMR
MVPRKSAPSEDHAAVYVCVVAKIDDASLLPRRSRVAGRSCGEAERSDEACRRGVGVEEPVPVGGPGLTVEVDETLFARRKYNRGRMLPQAWVVGGVCRETGHCFLARVADRSAARLISVIKENVADG